MTILCNHVQKELIFRTFDRVQAYEIVKNLYERASGVPLTTNEELRVATLELYISASYTVNEGRVREQLEKVNSLLDELIASPEWGDGEKIKLINELSGEKRKNEELNYMFSLQAKVIEGSLKDFISLLGGKDNISVTEEKQPENNELEKAHTCLTCSAPFTSKRKDSKYCSSKCKQIAYRERKERA